MMPFNARQSAFPLPQNLAVPSSSANNTEHVALMLMMDSIPSALIDLFEISSYGSLKAANENIHVVQEGQDMPIVKQYLILYNNSRWHREEVEKLKEQILGISPGATIVQVPITT